MQRPKIKARLDTVQTQFTKRDRRQREKKKQKMWDELTIGPFFKACSLANLQACLTANASIPSTCSYKKNPIQNPIKLKNKVDNRSRIQDNKCISALN